MFNLCRNIYIYTYIHACMHDVCVYIYICVCVCVYIYIYIYVHIYIYIHTNTLRMRNACECIVYVYVSIFGIYTHIHIHKACRVPVCTQYMCMYVSIFRVCINTVVCIFLEVTINIRCVIITGMYLVFKQSLSVALSIYIC